MTTRMLIGIYLLSLSSITWGQSKEICYERFVNEAIEAQHALDYDLAIHKFEAAQICPDKPLKNELDSLLKAVNTIKIEALTKATEKAEQSEQEVRQQLIISEGARLAFLANQEREKGHAKAALKLAYRAMEITGDKASQAIQRAFGDAVYQSTKKELSGHRQNVRLVQFSNDGQLLLTVSNDSTLIVWKNNGEKVLHLKAFNTAIQSAEFAPNGQQLLTASGNLVELWNLKGERIQQLKGHDDLVYKATFSPRGALIATCSRDQSIGLWDSATGQQLASSRRADAAITNVHFSNDDDLLLGLSANKSILIWNGKGTLVQQIKHHNLYFGGASFGPKKDQVVSFTVDHAIQIWDINSGQLLKEIKAHDGIIRQVLMAPDQSGFLSCSADKLAIFWQMDGKEQFRLDNHLGTVNKVNMSKDGKYLLTCSKDKTAKFYTRNGQLLMDLIGFSAAINNVSISSNNQQIAVVGEEPTVYLCQNPETYYPYLKQHPPEAFTKEEKEKYTIFDQLK